MSLNRIDVARKLAKSLDFDAAVSAYKDAIVFNTFPLIARVELGRLLVSMGKREEGINILSHTTDLFPNSDKPYAALGAALLLTGEKEQAQKCFVRAVEINEFAPSWQFFAAGRTAADIIALEVPNVAYIPMPKCGSSTIKAHILKLSQGVNTINPHQFFENPFFKTTGQSISIYSKAYKFVVVRDPIKRFLSYYNNNVVKLGSLGEPYAGATEVFGLKTKPELNSLIELWDDYRYVFDDFRHHTLGQAAYFGTLSDFDDVYPLESIGELLGKLSKFFNSEALPEHLMRSERPISNIYEQLSLRSLKQLFEIYHSDYELLGKYYSKQALLNEFKQRFDLPST